MENPAYLAARHEQGARPRTLRRGPANPPRIPVAPEPVGTPVLGAQLACGFPGHRVEVQLDLGEHGGPLAISLTSSLARALGVQLLARSEGR